MTSKAKRIAFAKQAIENLRAAIAAVEADPGPDADVMVSEYRAALAHEETKLRQLEGR